MCGIAGFYFRDRRDCELSVLKAMTDSIRHRGPDAEGAYIRPGIALGHRRLSIIDLSSGAQPMSNARGDLHLVFNGEIYNFRLLKKQLESQGQNFRTNSDTEVILACYERFGDSFVDHLNGMFALALWDDRNKRLILARDRIGKKPLYYHATDDGVVFASELKALLRGPSMPRDIDEVSVDEYFSFGYIPEPHTIYRNIKKLPAATMMIVDGNSAKMSKYWSLPLVVPVARDEADYAEEVLSVLEDSVRIRMISDVPLGVFLSGGIDSSAVTGLMAKNSAQPVKTFSIRGGDAEFDELPYARAVARMHGTEHHEFDLPAEKLESVLPGLVNHFDEPFGDSSMLPTYYVSHLARQHVTVALSGEGGDELFAGYDWQRKYDWIRRRWAQIPKWLRAGLLARILPSSIEPRIRSNRVESMIYRASIANRLSLDEDAIAYRNLVTAYSGHMKSLVFSRDFFDRCRAQPSRDPIADAFLSSGGLSPLSAALRSDFSVYLPGDLLTKVDRMSMANSLEVRCPLLDYRLAELATRIPDSMKVKGGLSKYILRKAVGSVLPIEVMERRTKRGFSVPVSKWFRGDAAAYTRSVLLDSSVTDSPIFSRDGIETLLNRHERHEYDYGPQIWCLLVFALWSRQNITI
jgi:asparagine synthase (glutamine-hydrolysing)